MYNIGARLLYEEYSTGNVVLNNVMCNGTEQMLFDCEYDIIVEDSDEVTYQCDSHAGVICEGIRLTLSLLEYYSLNVCLLIFFELSQIALYYKQNMIRDKI